MKKIILLVILLVTIVLISVSRQPAQNQLPLKNAPEGEPRILLMLKNDTGLSSWSPSLWWSYKHANGKKPGC